ncbi:hypothetical protein BC938DRAFT_478681 [Jimgerdemannia flammicorona]|uniref:Uncharacterized protein n=1 Tax=Jimgerdemannia flammicorona TaxID=994334 RepID=A0A433QMI4_9FUNG|nr:hypothetical protein BC938DRAFT_478681 [Jimgerdemannia flammicorona]
MELRKFRRGLTTLTHCTRKIIRKPKAIQVENAAMIQPARNGDAKETFNNWYILGARCNTRTNFIYVIASARNIFSPQPPSRKRHALRPPMKLRNFKNEFF